MGEKLTNFKDFEKLREFEGDTSNNIGHMRIYNEKLPHSPDVVGDRTHDNTNLLPLRSFHSTNNSCQRDWWFVDLAHKQSLQHNLIELSISPPCKESVQLDEYAEIRVLRHGGLSVLLFVFVVFNVDTHFVVGSLNAYLKKKCEELLLKSTTTSFK